MCMRLKVHRRVCACAHRRDKESAVSLFPLPRPLLSEFGRGSPGAPAAVMACSWLLWYRLGILALMMCKMSKQCLWHLQMAPPWPVLPKCSLIHRNGGDFFKRLPDARSATRDASRTPQQSFTLRTSVTFFPFISAKRWRNLIKTSSPRGKREKKKQVC